MALSKDELVSHLQALMQEKVASIEAEISALVKSRNTESKSTAGDKHEVGRAMAQNELDNLNKQLALQMQQAQELNRIEVESVNDEVSFGSMVKTNAGTYLVSIGLGVIELDSIKYFVVSAQAPVIQQMMGKRVGESISFNGRTIVLESIA